MSVSQEPVTAALLVALATSGLAGGDHEAPVPTPTDEPYWLLEYLWSTTWGPPLVDHNESAVVVYQVTSVGQRRDQVERCRDRLRQTILGRTPTGAYLTAIAPAGLAVIDRDHDSSAPVDIVDTVVTASERYRLTVTPL